jgi:hypothetical protein
MSVCENSLRFRMLTFGIYESPPSSRSGNYEDYTFLECDPM